MKTRSRWLLRGLWSLMIIFILMNLVGIFHSYKFTHFADPTLERTKDPKELTTAEKVQTLLMGVSNPRPTNLVVPSSEYETILLQSNKEIECWYVRTEDAKGTVILFHGFSGKKSMLLDKSEIFRDLGYNTFLVDFMGSGGSEGNQTTIGFFEAEQVKSAYEYLKDQGEDNIYLFGTSMGSVAIMKAINDFGINPDGIILECPFGSMYRTVCARFEIMNAPTFPMAGLLVFWGGLQNGFWAFGHNPAFYAEGIQSPTLLIYGAKDNRVSREETNEIFNNLKGPKTLKVYPEAGHNDILINYEREWTQDVKEFLMGE